MDDPVPDALRQATGADAALVNGGSIRQSLTAGEVTEGDMITTFPFCNTVETIRVTGAQRLAMVEGRIAVSRGNRRFPQVSGIEFAFDLWAPAGSRVLCAAAGGQALDPGRVYLPLRRTTS